MLKGRLAAAAAHLYFLSNSVQFGEFRLSVHRDNPDLPLSPIYLHYPKQGQPGSELLPALYGLLGELFFELTQAQGIEWRRIAAVPKGAIPLAASLLHRLESHGLVTKEGDPILRFGKEEKPNGETVFTLPRNVGIVQGERLLVIEDHTSGGRNKKLICAAAEDAGLTVTDILTAVDRQQGGYEAMANEGRVLHSLFTLDDLLDFGHEQDYIDEEMVDRVRNYIAENSNLGVAR